MDSSIQISILIFLAAGYFCYRSYMRKQAANKAVDCIVDIKDATAVCDILVRIQHAPNVDRLNTILQDGERQFVKYYEILEEACNERRAIINNSSSAVWKNKYNRTRTIWLVAFIAQALGWFLNLLCVAIIALDDGKNKSEMLTVVALIFAALIIYFSSIYYCVWVKKGTRFLKFIAIFGPIQWFSMLAQGRMESWTCLDLGLNVLWWGSSYFLRQAYLATRARARLAAFREQMKSSYS
jgi:hypothetical protein